MDVVPRTLKNWNAGLRSQNVGNSSCSQHGTLRAAKSIRRSIVIRTGYRAFRAIPVFEWLRAMSRPYIKDQQDQDGR